MDRVPTPEISGALGPFVGVEINSITVGADTDLTAVELNVLAEPTDPAGATVEIRRRTGVGTSALVASIVVALAQRRGSFAGSVAVPAGAELFMLVTADGGDTSHLTGSMGFGADVLLTSLDRVKSHGNFPGTADDSLLLELIGGASAMAQAYCGRPILLRSFVAERHPEGAEQDEVLLNQFPVVGTPTVLVDGITVTAFEVDAAAGVLRRVSGARPCPWGGVVTVTYQAGYASVPVDIRLAVTKQVRHEFRQAAPGGDRLGEKSHILETGGQSVWESDGLLPSVIAALSPYRQMRARS